MPGDLGVWRRDTHAADKMRMHTHTVTHYCFIDIDYVFKVVSQNLAY